MENALVHRVGDVRTLAGQITLLHKDRGLLERLRAGGLLGASELTWGAAGKKLFSVYQEIIEAFANSNSSEFASARVLGGTAR